MEGMSAGIVSLAAQKRSLEKAVDFVFLSKPTALQPLVPLPVHAQYLQELILADYVADPEAMFQALAAKQSKMQASQTPSQIL
jgi:hypothetical protein